MKKILALTFIVLSFILSSCEQDCNCPADYLSIKTVIGNVNANSWAYSNIDNNNYFSATIPVPEITKDVLRNGVVKVYRVFNYNQGNETHTELPFLLQCEYIDENGDAYPYTTETMAEISVGQVTIIYTDSEFIYELDETFIPETMTFRIVVMY
ncbi:MAG: hypothetical protein ACI3ZT_08330 [Candidatus Cryptobacteroides sp.]